MSLAHVDVLIVGAGLSGVGAACRLQAQCPGKTFAILEARGAIGGTWDLFRYPGIRSDSDMFTLGYSFQPWTEAKAIADGESIREYVQRTARERGVADKIRFHHRVVRVEWSTGEAQWTVEAQRTDTGETVRITCGFLFVNSGYYRYDEGFAPKFPGADRFGGTIVHPQHWPEKLDYTGKRVVVIGSGATAVTLAPTMAGEAEHVTMLQRSPSYVLSLPSTDRVADRLRSLLPAKIAYPVVRWKNVLTTVLFFQLSRRQPRLVKRFLRKNVRNQLPANYDVDAHFSPRYDPWDQRVCFVPDGDLFKAVCNDKLSIVTDTINTFTEKGITLASGKELEADIIVTATGLNLLPIGGMALTVDGEAIEIEKTLAYKGMMVSGVPNFAFTIGYTNASWTLKADLVAGYVCRLLNHMDKRGYRYCTPTAPESSSPTEPLIDLKSGYVLRSLDKLPKQGPSAPWRLYQNYPRDVLLMRHGSLEDGAMRFFRSAVPATKEPMNLMRNYVFAGGTAVVTGAASGIGEALAHALAARGSNLVLLDRDADRLEAVATTIGGEHSTAAVSRYVVDLADAEAIQGVARTLLAEHPHITLVVNNAGVALGGRFDQVTLDEFQWVMDINFRATVLLTHALLPALKAAPGSHLVNVSSVFGLIAPAGQSAYAASKFAVRGFTEAIRHELVTNGVGVTAVHPGGIRTRIAESARVGSGVPEAERAAGQAQWDRLLTMAPARAAAVIMNGIEHRRPRVLIGWSAKVPDLLARLVPGSYARVLAVATNLLSGARKG